MWGADFTFGKAARARKAAVGVIAPLVAQTRERLREIPAHAWLDPYLIGFMATLITIIARQRFAACDSRLLASIQEAAWGEITGLPPELLGQEIIALSMAQNRNFISGCQDSFAIAKRIFCEAATSSAAAGWSDLSPGALTESAFGDGEIAAALDERADLARLWIEYFDARIVELPLARSDN
ncbi:hypothetical protein [Terrarubrum flagellatum]|uniref:hypothetical protein n=1 Tax=Terrirubrum flagellatum TaxID=2895980 RepID=UPI0031450B9A